MNYIKYLNEFLNENNSFQDKPEIFTYTIYRLPTIEELEDVNSFNLSSEDIVNGFHYTIVGRGINSKKNIDTIIQSIEMLCKLYPENDNYKNALIEAKTLTYR